MVPCESSFSFVLWFLRDAFLPPTIRLAIDRPAITRHEIGTCRSPAHAPSRCVADVALQFGVGVLSKWRPGPDSADRSHSCDLSTPLSRIRSEPRPLGRTTKGFGSLAASDPGSRPKIEMSFPSGSRVKFVRIGGARGAAGPPSGTSECVRLANLPLDCDSEFRGGIAEMVMRRSIFPMSRHLFANFDEVGAPEVYFRKLDVS